MSTTDESNDGSFPDFQLEMICRIAKCEAVGFEPVTQNLRAECTSAYAAPLLYSNGEFLSTGTVMSKILCQKKEFRPTMGLQYSLVAKWRSDCYCSRKVSHKRSQKRISVFRGFKGEFYIFRVFKSSAMQQ